MPTASRVSKCRDVVTVWKMRPAFGARNGVPARVTAEENLITISTTGPNRSGVYRHVEIGVIKEVEEVSAKLQADPLLETNLF